MQTSSPKSAVTDPVLENGEGTKNFINPHTSTAFLLYMPSIEGDDLPLNHPDSSAQSVDTSDKRTPDDSTPPTSTWHSSSTSDNRTLGSSISVTTSDIETGEPSRPQAGKGKTHKGVTPAPKKGPGRPRLPESVKEERAATKKAEQEARKAARSAKTAVAKAERATKRRKIAHGEQSHRQRQRSKEKANAPSNKPHNKIPPEQEATLIHLSQDDFRPGPAPVGIFRVKRGDAMHIPGSSGTATCEEPWLHPASVYFGQHPEFYKHGSWFYNQPPIRFAPRSPSVCTERTLAAEWGPENPVVDDKRDGNPAETDERESDGLATNEYNEEVDNSAESDGCDFDYSDMREHEAMNPESMDTLDLNTPSVYVDMTSQPPLSSNEIMVLDSRNSGLIDPIDGAIDFDSL